MVIYDSDVDLYENMMHWIVLFGKSFGLKVRGNFVNFFFQLKKVNNHACVCFCNVKKKAPDKDFY